MQILEKLAVPAKSATAPSVITLTSAVIDRERSLSAELLDSMNDRIVAQDEAKHAVTNVLINGIFNVLREQGALGAVFLAGPTGVGKTELARTLAWVLLGDANAFTKIPCETMPHPADIGRLVGSSAGYIGYGDTPWLSDKRVHAGYKAAKAKGRLHPLLNAYEMENFSIVLVDEIEKAHQDISSAFLNALQSGEMAMSSGKEGANGFHSKEIDHSGVTDLRNTLFIFTSNVGEHDIAKGKGASMGFAATASANSSGDYATFEKALKRQFAPEFLGRMDATVRCHPITGEHLKQIMALNVNHVNRALREKGYFESIRLDTTPAFVEHALKEAGKEEFGARAISGIVKKIGARIGMALQSGRLPDEANGIIRFDVEGSEPTIRFESTPGYVPSESPRLSVPGSEHSSEAVRALVEGKINNLSDSIRDTVFEYLYLLSEYEPEFKDARKVLEARLEQYGFRQEELASLQASAFLSLYESTEKTGVGEVIVREGAEFEPVGFRAIEKYLRVAVAKDFPLPKIYRFIRVLLDRPMSRNEAIVTSQHIHRLQLDKKH